MNYICIIEFGSGKVMIYYKTEMGLEDFHYSYYPSFKIQRRVEVDKFDKTIEYLKAIKHDLQGIEFLIEDVDDINKKYLASYLRSVIDAILIDVSEIIKLGIERPIDELNLIVNDYYILFSVYTNYRLSNKADISKPLGVLVSRSLKNLEFYFLEKLEKDGYYDSYYVTHFKVGKDNIEMYSILDYNSIHSEITLGNESCLKKLEKILR